MDFTGEKTEWWLFMSLLESRFTETVVGLPLFFEQLYFTFLC
jgi:hypothetical protein